MNRDTIIGIIIGGLITIVSAYFFFLLSDKKSEPVYSVVNKPSIIFDKNNSSPKIKLIVDDSILIKENVYITTLSLWNKGKLPIEKKDLRKDFIIYCSDSISKILDYNILEQKERGISNFILSPLGNGLKINWDYFDSKSGFKFQIIYTGDSNTEVKVSGLIQGSKVKQVTTNEKRRLSSLAYFLIIVVGYGILFYQCIDLIKLLKRANALLVLAIIVDIIGILFLFVVLFKTIHSIFAINPPF